MSATHLVLEESISDIFRHSGHSQNIILTFLVSLDTDTTVEHSPLIPNQPESAERELERLRVEIDGVHPLEQIRPSPVLVGALECIVNFP